MLNRINNIGPNQKLGMEMPIKASTAEELSIHEYGRKAEATPSGNAISRAMINDARASSIVDGMAWISLSATVTPRSSHNSPRVPFRTLPQRSRYCVVRGASRPRHSRSESLSISSACSPKIDATGSPGTRRTARNTSVTTPATTSKDASKRRIRKVAIASCETYIEDLSGLHA